MAKSPGDILIGSKEEVKARRKHKAFLRREAKREYNAKTGTTKGERKTARNERKKENKKLRKAGVLPPAEVHPNNFLTEKEKRKLRREKRKAGRDKFKEILRQKTDEFKASKRKDLEDLKFQLANKIRRKDVTVKRYSEKKNDDDDDNNNDNNSDSNSDDSNSDDNSNDDNNESDDNSSSNSNSNDKGEAGPGWFVDTGKEAGKKAGKKAPPPPVVRPPKSELLLKQEALKEAARAIKYKSRALAIQKAIEEEEVLRKTTPSFQQEMKTRPVIAHNLTKFTEEIHRYVSKAELSPREVFEREKAVNDLRGFLTRMFKGRRVPNLHVFGSYFCGLATTGSDIDIVLIDPAVPIVLSEPAKALDYLAKTKPDILRTIRQIGGLFRNRKAIWGSATVIPARRVPLIKLYYTPLQIHMDLTYNAVDGVFGSDFVRSYVHSVPAFREACIVLRLFIKQMGYQDPRAGGLASFGLTLMLIAYTKTFMPHARREQTGELVAGFLYYYGYAFNSRKQVVDVRTTLDQHVDIKTLSTESHQIEMHMLNDQLWIVNSLTPSANVVGALCYWDKVRLQFRHAYDGLIKLLRLDPHKGGFLPLKGNNALQGPGVAQNKRSKMSFPKPVFVAPDLYRQLTEGEGADRKLLRGLKHDDDGGDDDGDDDAPLKIYVEDGKEGGFVNKSGEDEEDESDDDDDDDDEEEKGEDKDEKSEEEESEESSDDDDSDAAGKSKTTTTTSTKTSSDDDKSSSSSSDDDSDSSDDDNTTKKAVATNGKATASQTGKEGDDDESSDDDDSSSSDDSSDSDSSSDSEEEPPAKKAKVESNGKKKTK